MRLLHACPPSCKRLRIDAETAGTAEQRLRALELVDQMVAGGMGRLDALKAIGLARSTYYDWRRAFRRGGAKALKPRSTRPRAGRRRRWTDADDQAVLKLRARSTPTWARRGSMRCSPATGWPCPSRPSAGYSPRPLRTGGSSPRPSAKDGLQPKRRRNFDGAWADRWRYGDKAQAPGELVQVDHMTYTKDGRTLKEFRAICPTTKHMVARVFWRATANNAKRFLRAMAEAMPFPIASIQRAARGARRPAAASSAPTSSAPARTGASRSRSCRREGPSGTGASSAPTGPPGSSSGTATTAPSPSPTSPPSSPTTSSSTTTCAPTRRWIAEPPTSTLSTSKTMPVPTAKVPKGPEPLHLLTVARFRFKIHVFEFLKSICVYILIYRDV